MPYLSRTTTVVVVLALVSAPITLSTGAMTDAGVTNPVQEQDDDFVAVDSCTTIDEPGQYKLTENVSTNDSSCISINSSDVVFDGGGHDINNTAPLEYQPLYKFPTGTGVEVDDEQGLSNVTVKNVTGHRWSVLVSMSNVTNGEVTGVVTPHAERASKKFLVTTGVSITHSQDVSVHNNTLQHPIGGPVLWIDESSDVRVRNNTIAHLSFFAIYTSSDGIFVWDSNQVTVADNHFEKSPVGIELRTKRTDDLRVSGNTFNHSELWLRETNVSIQDNEFIGWMTTVTGNEIRLTRNTFTQGFISLRGENVTVSRNTFRDDTRLSVGEPDATKASGVRVVENTFVDSGVAVGSANTIVRDNEISAADGTGISVSSADVIVRENEISAADGTGISVREGENVTIRHNSITDSAVGIEIYDSPNVTENELRNNSVGIKVNFIGEPARIASNEIRDNEVGIRVRNSTGLVCGEPNQLAVHENAFVNNTRYAIENEDPRVVNATHNYWGGDPASPQDPDAPFRDPVTDEPADGSGGAVSEGSTDGISNVHFDPWLDQDPTEDSENETA